MRIKIIALLTVLFFCLCACTLQEKMSPFVFIERFSVDSGDDFTVDESFDENGRYIIFISDKNDEKYACELIYDSGNNIKKICLAGNNPSRADMFEILFGKLIKVYAPDENNDEIISVLFVKNWNYHSTQWYDYSSIVTDEGIFASVENKKFASESDACLTLKQNDIIHP